MHAHHQKETLRGYIVPVSRLVAALLRPSSHYTFPSSPSLSAAIESLKAARDDESRQTALHSVFIALWLTQWPASVTNRYPDPTMCFLMLFSLKESGEFSGPKDTTRPIGTLCRGIQLAMVREIHRLVDECVFSSQMEAFEDVAPFVVEKQNTTFNSLMSLQHYATALAYKSLSLPNIWWIDREKWEVMLYMGQRITMAQLGQIFDRLEAKIIDLWENKVLLGLKLHVGYADLADNLTSSDPGYSFLDEPSNPFLALKNKLAEAIFANKNLHAKFFVLDGDGQEQPNIIFCRKWLMALAELEGLLMLAIEMESGAAPRGTELASMLVRNSRTRLRNLRAMGKFLAAIRQYDKTTNNFQCDRLIPHAISALNADVVIQAHTYARPFAQVSLLPFI